MHGDQNGRGGGLDQDLELLAGDIRIHSIAEGFLFPIEPGLEAFPIELTRDEPVEETEQAPGDAVVNL